MFYNGITAHIQGQRFEEGASLMTELEQLTENLERIHALALVLQERLLEYPVEYILAEMITEIAAS